MGITIRYKTFTKSWMIDMALPKFDSNTFRAAALSAAIVAMPPALADETKTVSYTDIQPTAVYVDNLWDAGLQSRKYARENDAIGMVISYGAYDGAPSPIAVGEKFKDEINKRGEESKYFIVEISEPGFSIAFDNPYTSSEPMTLKDAAGSLSEIIAQKKRMGDYLSYAPSTEFE